MYYLVHVQRWYEDNPVEGEPPVEQEARSVFSYATKDDAEIVYHQNVAADKTAIQENRLSFEFNVVMDDYGNKEYLSRMVGSAPVPPEPEPEPEANEEPTETDGEEPTEGE